MTQHATVETLAQTVRSYRNMIDKTISQLTDDEFFKRPSPQFNSVAVILRHLGGNLSSRWTDFLTTDGEKESRDRDQEFADWKGSREELMDYFSLGWTCLTNAIDQINETNLSQKIKIRGEVHTVIQALVRSVTHISYHVGQIAILARMAHAGDWNWLTVAPNKSAEFNQQTWGTSKSRSVFDTNTELD